MLATRLPVLFVTCLAALATACGDLPADDEIVDAGAPPEPVDAGPPPPCEPVEPSCRRYAPNLLRFGTSVAPGFVTNASDGAGWTSELDATSSRTAATRASYLYVRFDPDEGLQKVPITDAQSLDSTEWDFAFRRFSVRINSGDSGPSCVNASRVDPRIGFDDVASPIEALSWRTDDFFSNACTLIPDGSGLGFPDTALSSYYAFGQCLQMTKRVYLLRLRSGRHVKLLIESVYTPDQQANCDAGGHVPFFSAGNVRLRWSFVD